jgi:DNA-binding NtrC family response regulator
MRVLVIDNELSDRKKIVNALQGSKAPDGQRFDIVEASKYQEAIKEIVDSLDDKTKKPFDIVIVDMNLGKGKEGIDIIKHLAGKSSVAIVITINSNIPNCVEAMRAGAWDYIEKQPFEGKDPYRQQLPDSIRKAYEYFKKNPERGVPNPDIEWIHKHFKDLMKKHPGKLVAVLYEKVVDSGPNFAELVKRLESKFPLAKPTIVSIPASSKGGA